MKKLFIGGTAAALIAAAGISTPYYLGNQAKQSLETQHRILADTFFFDIVSRQYQSGWLESTETTVLRFHPTVLANLGNNIPDNIRAVLEKPITMINHVRHQPFANGIVPVRAVVETEFQYDPEVKKTLTRFFGEQIPVKLHNVIQLNGSGTLTIAVAPFDYEELSGIKINWQGLTGNINYQKGYASYTTQLAMPSFQAILADKGSLKIENLTLNANSYNSKDGKTTLGSSTTNLAHFDVAWNEGMDYNIKINDLINTVTDLQIGAFINPRGTIAPNKISVDNLSYATETSEPAANAPVAAPSRSNGSIGSYPTPPPFYTPCGFAPKCTVATAHRHNQTHTTRPIRPLVATRHRARAKRRTAKNCRQCSPATDICPF